MVKTIIVAGLVCLTIFSVGISTSNRNQTLAGSGPQAAKTAPQQAAPKTTTAPVDDASITAAVRAKLARTPSLKDTNINVVTRDGIVTLTGLLKTGGLKGVATNVTKSVKGVKKVDNQIAVEHKPKTNAAGESKPANRSVKP